jgi:hypothetical protein
LIRPGTVCSYAAAARLGHVSWARMSQILGLLNLAQDLQEQFVFLEQTARSRPALVLRQVLTVAAALECHEQRRHWRKLWRIAKQSRHIALKAKRVLPVSENS